MILLFQHLIAERSGITERQVSQVLNLLNDGATIPFISRYRKEATGGLNEVDIEAIKNLYESYKKRQSEKRLLKQQ